MWHGEFCKSSHVIYIRAYNVQACRLHAYIYQKCKLCLYNCSPGHGSDGVDDRKLIMKRI